MDTVNDAKTILEMIETVSPDDRLKLAMINTRAKIYLEGHKIRSIEERGIHYRILRVREMNIEGWPKTRTVPIDNYITYADALRKDFNYTGSLDALDTIRPDGWSFIIAINEDGLSGCTVFKGTEKCFWDDQCSFKTEKLARLHALIKAVEYDRAQN